MGTSSSSEPAVDFKLSEDMELLKGSARDFARSEILPFVMNHDEAQEFPAPIINKMADAGAGNYAMCGKAYDPRLIFAWPSAQIAVIGERQTGETFLGIKVQATGQGRRAHFQRKTGAIAVRNPGSL